MKFTVSFVVKLVSVVGQFLDNLTSKREVARFAFVGIFGLVLETVLISFLLNFLLESAAHARVISLPISILSTWYLNRVFTFQDHSPDLMHQAARYYFFMGIGVAINYGIYWIALRWLGELRYGYVFAIVCGSLSSMTINFLNMRIFIFKKPS